MKKKLLILLALTPALFASCSSDSDEAEQQLEPIMLGTAIQTTTTRGNSQTLQATELEAGQTVGIYVYYKDATTKTGTYGYENIAYTVTGAAGDLAIVTAAQQPYYPEQKNQNVDIYAFAPRVYTGTAALNTLTAQDVFTTASDQTTDANYNASDFVWGKAANVAPQTVSGNSRVTIPLSHKLSKVNINITWGTGLTQDLLTGASIKLNGVQLKGTVNFTTGAVTPSSGTNPASAVTLTSATSSLGTFKSDATKSAFTASAIIIPQTIAARTDFIEITLASGSSAVYKYTSTAATTFSAGEVTTYDITLDAAGIALTSTISPWTDTTPTIGTAEIQ